MGIKVNLSWFLILPKGPDDSFTLKLNPLVSKPHKKHSFWSTNVYLKPNIVYNSFNIKY